MLLVKYKLVVLWEIRSFPIIAYASNPLRLLLLSGVFIYGPLNSSHLFPGNSKNQRLLLLLVSRRTRHVHVLDNQTELRTSRESRMIDRLPSWLGLLVEVVVHPLNHHRVSLDTL